MNNRGQFSIIAALLVAVILIATVMMTYSTIRNSPIQNQPQVLSAVDETNLAIKQILGFTVGYYGSVLKVTGNSSYAKTLALQYLHSGLVNIGSMHPEWGASFNVNDSALYTCWFTNSSYSMGDLAVNYSLTGLGIYGITYDASCKLMVQVENSTATNQTQLIVTRDDGEPLINLGKQNFRFYRYAYADSTWELINPSSEPVAYANGTYEIDIPSGVDPYSYVLQVEDQRGIIVVASSFSRYTCTLTWNSTLYATTDATIVLELLQNGTMRWLGQDLQLTTQAKPIPPIPAKAIHVNQTANDIDGEVPFQIEDWASNYRIPLGLTNNASVFSSRTMLVFQVNSKVSKVTIWWNGSDAAVQTPLAYTNIYFSDTISNRTLNNGRQTLQFSATGFVLTSKMGSMTSTARLMRINNEEDNTDPELAYVIYNGVIRDIVLGEAEWSGGAGTCPNVYSNIVITLPANVTYYTYQLRLMFVESQKPRTITDLCPIKITTSLSSLQTENGISSGLPIVQNGTGTFYNSSSIWQHHWSQFISGTKGAGIMFTDVANQRLYTFDQIAGTKVGALEVSSTTKAIELLPVANGTVNFTYALDVTWNGAVVTFDGTTPIYVEQGGNKGLWITVERPPTIAVNAEA